MTTRREARQDWDWDRALEQGDTPEQIIKAYDGSSVVRAVVEAILDENKQRQDEGA